MNSFRTIAILMLAGLAGCDTAVEEETLPAATVNHESDPEQAADPLYGNEPLIPAISLGGDFAGNGDPIVGPTIPVAVGMQTGILAPDFTADPTAAFHPHGSEVCASGCAASNHATPELKRPAFNRLLASYQQGPLDETNAALESLLFYGRQSDLFLKSTEVSSSKHDQFLRQELKRTHALISFRVVDEKGVVRVEMKQTRVPLDRRHVFDMETHNIQPLVTSGTVKRVGLHHLWTRL